MDGGWRRLVNGLWIGVAIVLPGISGGTAALILGIYREFISGLTNFFRPGFWPLIGGILGGVMIGARAVGLAMDLFPSLLEAFLFGLVLASVPRVVREVGAFGSRQLAGLAAGAIIALAFAHRPTPGAATGADLSLLKLFLGGLVAGGVMIFPGMSGGTILILLGQYRPVLQAVNGLDWPLLAAFAAGGLGGLVTLSRAVGYLLSRYQRATMAGLAGLMLGSLRSLWPGTVGLPEGAAFALGVGFVIFLTRGRR